MNSRIPHLDTLRCLACFLVVLTHSAIPAVDPSQGAYYAFISVLCTPSSELFLALSGALLLPVKKETKIFYKQRFTKLLSPLLFWSLFAIAIKWTLGKLTLEQSLTALILIPVKPCIGTYWFMYVLVGLYLFAPVISKWLMTTSKKELQFFLFLWIITISLPLLNYIKPYTIATQGSFYDTLFPFSGFLGYMLLGYYCIKYPINISVKSKALILFFISEVCIFSLFGATKFIFDDYAPLMSSFSITTALQVFILINFVYNINDLLLKIQPILTNITKYLFGVYLIHIFIIRDLVWLVFKNNRLHPILETLSIACLSMAISLAIIWGISKLPKSKYIIGI